MRALFIGGTVDNSELDLDFDEAPRYYPPRAAGQARDHYQLYEIGRHGSTPAYAVYAAMELPRDEIERIIDERDYPRRFAADRREPAPR